MDPDGEAHAVFSRESVSVPLSFTHTGGARNVD
jgi:hypothetical protein